MESSQERFEEYGAGIDKALRRAAKRAALTAAATGTRLIIYDKDQIKRLRPLEFRNLPGVGKYLEPPRLGKQGKRTPKKNLTKGIN